MVRLKRGEGNKLLGRTILRGSARKGSLRRQERLIQGYRAAAFTAIVKSMERRGLRLCTQPKPPVSRAGGDSRLRGRHHRDRRRMFRVCTAGALDAQGDSAARSRGVNREAGRRWSAFDRRRTNRRECGLAVRASAVRLTARMADAAEKRRAPARMGTGYKPRCAAIRRFDCSRVHLNQFSCGRTVADS